MTTPSKHSFKVNETVLVASGGTGSNLVQARVLAFNWDGTCVVRWEIRGDLGENMQIYMICKTKTHTNTHSHMLRNGRAVKREAAL